jgi:hypothetical protein
MNKRDLKAYSRFDGTGRIVPGSTVLRRQKPKVGNWKEVPAYECCNDVTLTFDMPDVSINDVSLRLFCNDTQIAYGYTPRDSANVTDVINILNDTFNMIGVFSNPSAQIIQLVMSGAQKTALCPVGTLTFDVIAD